MSKFLKRVNIYKNMDKAKIKKILVIRNDKIGDLITSTNVFRELKKNFPNAKISALVSKSSKKLIERNKNIDKIFVADYPPTNYKNFVEYIKTFKLINREKFDVGIDLRGSIFNILLMQLAGIKYKIGYYNRYFSRLFLDFAYKKDRLNTHASFQRIDLINKAMKINSKNYKLDIASDKEDNIEFEKIIRRYKLRKFICIIPDAGLEYKQWPLEKFNEIIAHLADKYKEYKVILIGHDMNKMKWLSKRNPQIIMPDELINLRIAYLLFKKCSLVITHDGGPMHLAGAANAKIIAFIPGHLALPYYRPLGDKVSIISKDIKKISVEEVKREIDKILDRSKSP